MLARVCCFNPMEKVLTLIKQAPVAMSFLRGPSYIIEIANDQALLLWGKTSEEVLNRPALEAFPELKGQNFLAIYDQVFHRGETYVANEMPLKMVRYGKEEFLYINFTYEPYRNEEGIVTGIIGVGVDVTEQVLGRKRIEDTEKQFSVLANAMPQLVWVADPDGKVTYYNDRVQEFAGAKLLPDGTWSWEGLLHDDDVQPTVQSWATSLRKGSVYEISHRVQMTDGTYRWFLSRAFPQYNTEGKIVKWFGTATDIHSQKVAEEKIKQSELKTREAKEELELTIRNIPSAIFHFDRHGKILYLNEKAALLMGYESVDAVLSEHDIYNFRRKLDENYDILDVHGNPLPIEASSASIAFNTLKSSEVITHFINRKNGSAFWILSKSTPMFDDQNQLVYVLTSSTDITVQKTAEEKIRKSEGQLREVADFMPQLVWVTDDRGRTIFFNNGWFQFSGLGYEQLRDGGWLSLIHPDDYEYITVTKSLTPGAVQVNEMEYRMLRADGVYRWMLVRAIPLKDESGKIVRWFGTCTDIHDQKMMTRNLEQLVEERTRELQRINDDLQQFAHVTSHDLKEPVRKVKTFGHMLQDECGHLLPPRGREYLAKMESAASRMYTMIDGVLRYSSLSGENLFFEKIDLTSIIDTICSDLEVLIQEKNAVIKYQNLPEISGASILIHQLFYNLINNSLKFSKKEVPPVISIYAPEETDWYMEEIPGTYRTVIRISDNGIGFDQVNAHKIFKTFTRLHGKNEYEGTGLGLALCKKIVERHGGFIFGEGKHHEGATFTIVLPLKMNTPFPAPDGNPIA